MYKQNIIEKWTNDYVFLFLENDDLGITKNYRGLNLIILVAEVYSALLLNRIEPEAEKNVRKNQSGFRRNRSTDSDYQIIGGVRAKTLKATLLFIDFSKTFDFIKRQME